MFPNGISSAREFSFGGAAGIEGSEYQKWTKPPRIRFLHPRATFSAKVHASTHTGTGTDTRPYRAPLLRNGISTLRNRRLV